MVSSPTGDETNNREARRAHRTKPNISRRPAKELNILCRSGAYQGPKGNTEARKDLAELRTTINASPDDSWRDHFIERLDEYESLFPYEQPSEKDEEN